MKGQPIEMLKRTWTSEADQETHRRKHCHERTTKRNTEVNTDKRGQPRETLKITLTIEADQEKH